MLPEFHPHNIFTFCPKCGKASLYILNEKAQACNNCDFLFYTNAAAAVAAIIENEKGEIMLTTRAVDPAKGMLDLPGGFADHNESIETALVREIKEELNIELSEYHYFASFPNQYLYKNILYYTLDMIFICKVKSYEHIIAADDISAFAFFKITDETINKIGLQSIKKVLSAYIEYKKK
ncbi:MAG: NUDIX domain-containing protein [Bacteroidales bacterium]|nr:NUDIX domain-containing protein [Bacteroidales bacterium]